MIFYCSLVADAILCKITLITEIPDNPEQYILSLFLAMASLLNLCIEASHVTFRILHPHGCCCFFKKNEERE